MEAGRDLPQVTWLHVENVFRPQKGVGKLVLGMEAIAVWTGSGLTELGVGVFSWCCPRGFTKQREKEGEGPVELGAVHTQGRHHDPVL